MSMADPLKVTKADLIACEKACKKMTAEQICLYLCSLQKWIDSVNKCLKGRCGPGGGSPSEPPPWPPK